MLMVLLVRSMPLCFLQVTIDPKSVCYLYCKALDERSTWLIYRKKVTNVSSRFLVLRALSFISAVLLVLLRLRRRETLYSVHVTLTKPFKVF